MSKPKWGLSKPEWVKHQVVTSDRLKLLNEKASLAEIVNESKVGLFSNTPRKERLTNFSTGKPNTPMVCSEVSKSPFVIKCSCFRENVISKSWAPFGV